MKRFVLNPVTATAMLTVAYAGDLFRNALTTPVWFGIAVLAGLVGTYLAIKNFKQLNRIPKVFLSLLGWWLITPLWSPYHLTSLGLTLGALLTAAIGVGLALALPAKEFAKQSQLSLRYLLIGSLIFEVIVGIIGKPIFPIGLAVTENTSIELAWSRAQIFQTGERIQGLVGNANLLGMIALLLLLLAAGRLFSAGVFSPMATVDLLVAGTTIVLTSSATVTVALFVAGLAIVLLMLWRRKTLISKIAIAVFGAGIIAGFGLIVSNWPTFTALLGKSSDLTHRFDIWNAVLVKIADNPWFGHGFVGWWPSWETWFDIQKIRGIPVSQAHNLWMDLVMQTGIVGTVIALICVMAILIGLTSRLLNDFNAINASWLAIFVAMLVQGATESRMLTEWGLVLFAALAVYSKQVKTKSSL